MPGESEVQGLAPNPSGPPSRWEVGFGRRERGAKEVAIRLRLILHGSGDFVNDFGMPIPIAQGLFFLIFSLFFQEDFHPLFLYDWQKLEYFPFDVSDIFVSAQPLLEKTGQHFGHIVDAFWIISGHGRTH